VSGALPLSSDLPDEEQIELLIDALGKGQTLELTVNGQCMRPWARNGNTIIVKPLHRRPKRGNMLLTTDGQHLYAHRVVAIGIDGAVRTRGDLSAEMDPWRSADDLLGRVTGVRRRGVVWPLGWRVLELGALAAAPVLRVLLGTESREPRAESREP